jgi:Tol biopolymer transport system component
MKNILIALLVISVGFNVYFALQDNAKPSPETTLKEHSDLSIFQREGNTWVFYSVKENGSKEALGLRVPVQSNSSVPEWPEDIYASLSPDGKKVAYMQKPAWPHQIYVSNTDGTKIAELVDWGANFTPTHAVIENQFTWSKDGNALLYGITNENCGPAGSDGTLETILFKKDLISGKEETVLRSEHKCDEFRAGTKAIPVN